MAALTETATRRRYRSDRRTAQTRETRRRILDAAAAAFLTSGYAGTTMRAIAAKAQVSLPTVELSFRTKAGILKAAIDVAIAGDDVAIAVLDREWAREALAAATSRKLLTIVAGVLGPAQERSAGLVLALFEASTSDPELAELATQMINQRANTAAWLVAALIKRAPLREGCSIEEAIDTVWLLMDPAVFDRLTRQRQWTRADYEGWFANAVQRLLINDNSLIHQ